MLLARRVSLLALCVIFGACVTKLPTATLPARGPSVIQLAITVDDLPSSGDTVADWPKSRIIRSILQTLLRHRVPGVVGFFNGSNMDDEPETRAALRDWLAAGYRLANHTFSHGSANELGAKAFLADVEQDERLLAELGANQVPGPRYFRYPFLERGRQADRPLIRAYFKAHQLHVADVSVDFEDWAFTDAYARCTTRGDQTAVSDLSDEYMRNAMAELFWSSESAEHVLGRPLPQVLLIHANLITAHKLDALLDAYLRAGVKLVPLDEAQADPVYRELDDDRHGDVTLIEALIRARKAPLRSFMPPPSSLLELVCR